MRIPSAEVQAPSYVMEHASAVPQLTQLGTAEACTIPCSGVCTFPGRVGIYIQQSLSSRWWCVLQYVQRGVCNFPGRVRLYTQQLCVVAVLHQWYVLQ